MSKRIVALIVAFGSAALGAEGPARPNVVFIYCDDLAAWAIGADGNREVKTPNLDRLARDGVRFTKAFTTTPVCSPSRAGMFASRYSTDVKIADWINPTSEPNLGLAPSTITWPKLLKANGYKTALFGKWHLGTRPEFHPTRNGYDHFFGFLGGGNTPIDPTLEVAGTEKRLNGSLPDLLVDDALGWIETNKAGPFLVSLHFRAPHAPYGPVPAVDSDPFKSLDPTIPAFPGLPITRVKALTNAYYGSIHSVDRNVGRLLDRLDALNLTSKTIVIFTSDHGYMIGHHGLHHKGNATHLVEGKKGSRPNMFDDALRVPLIVRGVGKPGTTCDRVVSNLDLFPTILDLVGVGEPDNLILRGRSFAHLFEMDDPTWQDTLHGQYDMHHGAVARMRMIRTPEWKLVKHFEPGGHDELYDLKADPGESKNLAGSRESAETEVNLATKLQAWMSWINDPAMPRFLGN